jgi:hypothetical protein
MSRIASLTSMTSFGMPSGAPSLEPPHLLQQVLDA